MKQLEQFIEVPNGKIYLKTWEPNETINETPLILLHDSLGCIDMWRDFPSQLCEKLGRRIIAYDRLGFGKSSKRDNLPSIRFVNEEAELYFPFILEALGVKKFILFGHSVGGGMAIVCAGQFPKNCEAVITVSAQSFVEDRTLQGIIKAEEDFKNPKIFEKLEKYHGDKTNWVLNAWIKVWLSEEFETWSLKEALPKMVCPALVIHGDKDEYGSLRFPEMICELAGGTTNKKIILNGGHVPHRENPQLILEMVSNFLLEQKAG